MSDGCYVYLFIFKHKENVSISTDYGSSEEERNSPRSRTSLHKRNSTLPVVDVVVVVVVCFQKSLCK